MVQETILVMVQEIILVMVQEIMLVMVQEIMLVMVQEIMLVMLLYQSTKSKNTFTTSPPQRARTPSPASAPQQSVRNQLTQSKEELSEEIIFRAEFPYVVRSMVNTYGPN